MNHITNHITELEGERERKKINLYIICWTVTAATRPKGDEVVEVLARRHSMTVGHHTRLMKFGVDIQMGGKLQHLLNFTFHNNSHHK